VLRLSLSCSLRSTGDTKTRSLNEAPSVRSSLGLIHINVGRMVSQLVIMKRVQGTKLQLRKELPLPILSAWDPRAAASGSDPLGALRPFTAIATTLFPGITTTITTRARGTLSWVSSGLRLLDKTPSAPIGGRSDRPSTRTCMGEVGRPRNWNACRICRSDR
jgi:hypothetical protein